MNTTRIGAASLAGFALLALTACAGGQSTGGAGSSGGAGSGSAALGLVTDSVLTVCANLETPPNIYAEADGTPVGVEVDIAKAMADQMGLTIEFKEYNFAGLIPALQAKQCDTIMASLYIKPEREQIADFVPYLLSASGVAVSQENPAGVTGYDDSLCGVSAIGITGATGAVLLEEKSADCEKNGLAPIEITLMDKSSDALQQVIAGQADAFMDTSELVGYYEKQSGGDFKLVGDPVGEIQIGAASLKGNDALNQALQDAFDAVVADGRYDAILQKWGYESVSIIKA